MHALSFENMPYKYISADKNDVKQQKIKELVVVS